MRATTGASRADLAAMFAVCFLSLLLLVYVGVGEAQRTYAGFLSSKMAAQGEIIQNAMAGHLRAGLPLRQFVGFQTLSSQVFDSDESIVMLSTTDRSGKTVFSNRPKRASIADGVDPTGEAPGGDPLYANDRYEVLQSAKFLTVVLPLRSKFEEVGKLRVVMPKGVVQKAVNTALPPLLLFIGVLSAGFSWFVTASERGNAVRRLRRQEWSLGACFLATSIVVVGLLVSLYSEGAQVKAKALASSLRERVGAISELGISLADIDGIDRAFADYRSFNKDIQSIGLLRNGRYAIHTDPRLKGTAWAATPGTFEYKVEMARDAEGNAQAITVALPVNVVYKAIANSAKNFIVLFFASGFLAALVLQLANAIRQGSGQQWTAAAAAQSALEKCKPVLFLAVFVDNLSASFLPQLMRSYADAAHIAPYMVSVAFMAYFVCFAMILMPAGLAAQRLGPKPLLWVGALAIAMGLTLLVLTGNFALVILARILEGLGQGVLFIGVQTLVLSAAASTGQNKANGLIVYNFNAGMVSGMAIGSLLVLYMGTTGVFLFGLVGILALALYIFTMMPAIAAPSDPVDGQGAGRVFQALRSLEFLRVMLCVGIPSKAVLTGVIIFGLPMLLSKMAFESDEIGQIIMFYAVGVLVANYFVSKHSARLERMLGGGMLLGSCGLLLIGCFGLLSAQWVSEHEILMSLGLILGVLAVGLGHGAINAPVVTYVAHSKLAKTLGVVTTTSLYRVLERVGHVIGPMVVGQLLLLGGQSVVVVGWIGAALLFLTLVFQAGLQTRNFSPEKP